VIIVMAVEVLQHKDFLNQLCSCEIRMKEQVPGSWVSNQAGLFT
jgi:hypothetical protein